MKPQHISTLAEPPIVGRTYIVPCVELAGDWWPVQGPQHADADLGVPMQHVHYDGRFMTAAQVFTNLVTIRRTQRLAAQAELDAGAEKLGIVEWLFGRAHGRLPDDAAIQLVHQVVPGDAFVDRPRRCRRSSLEFPAGGVQAALEPQFEGIVTDCRTCPHRGMRIDQQPEDEEGGVVCPGHGLRWHRPTGRLMPRAR